jgi:hypothetical protein
MTKKAPLPRADSNQLRHGARGRRSTDSSAASQPAASDAEYKVWPAPDQGRQVRLCSNSALAASAFANPTTPHGKHRASGDGRVMTTAANITRAILADRVQRRGRKPA